MKSLRLAVIASLFAPAFATAQFGGMGGGMGIGGGGGLGGIYLDAEGVVRAAKQQTKAKSKTPSLPSELARRSDLRQVSLKSIDREIKAALKASDGEVPVDLQRLAGLFRIDYIILDHEKKDILLCGPAEGWTEEPDGRAVGITSKRPALDVYDVAMICRVIKEGGGDIRCSIDPVNDRLAGAMAYKFPELITGQKAQAEGIRSDIEELLGLQKVMTEGIPEGSRFARALVDADYRMKRMAMGLEKVRGLTSHLDTATSNTVAGRPTEGYARWWFTPAYDKVITDETKSVFQFEGAGLRLLHEKDFVDESGARRGSGKVSESGDLFSKSFNKMLPKLEERYPVFADLHNLFDVTMMVALVHQQGALAWLEGTVFLDSNLMAVPTSVQPRQAEPVVTYKQVKVVKLGRTGHFVGIAAGGVSITPSSVLGQPGFMQVGSSTGGKSGSGKSGSGTGTSTSKSDEKGSSQTASVPTIPTIRKAVTSERWWSDLKQ